MCWYYVTLPFQAGTVRTFLSHRTTCYTVWWTTFFLFSLFSLRKIIPWADQFACAKDRCEKECVWGTKESQDGKGIVFRMRLSGVRSQQDMLRCLNYIQRAQWLLWRVLTSAVIWFTLRITLWLLWAAFTFLGQVWSFESVMVGPKVLPRRH